MSVPKSSISPRLSARVFNLLLASLGTTLLIAPVALAQAGGAAATPPQPGLIEVLLRMVPLFIILFFVFYFLVIRPQERKLREQEALLSSLKKGETVVTTSGIIGRIGSLEEGHVVLELGGNAKLKVQSGYISQRFEKSKQKKAAN